MLKQVKRLWNDESGQGMTEYGLILALVSVVAIGALVFLGGELFGIFEGIGRTLEGTSTTTLEPATTTQ
ncbi:MAG: Flp family type IVb pilin [Bacillota bacterium]|nr:Flp family type IVb pilin [Bacillota bacterium]